MILLIDAFAEYSLDLPLTEAKGLHSMKPSDSIRQAVIDMGFDFDKGKFRQARRTASTVANRKFKKIFDDTKRDLIALTKQHLAWRDAKLKADRAGLTSDPEVSAAQRKKAKATLKNAPRLSKTQWVKAVKETLRAAYDAAFDAGIASSAAGRTTKFGVGPSEADRTWVESAFTHEMRYFNKLLKDIERGSVRGGLEKRLTAYAETLKHVFYAGRVMGTPTGMVIDWIAPMDRNTCKGCEFLAKNSPYTKDTLPSTPRAGDTPCLNRCRCRLVMRDVGKEEFARVKKKQRAKSWYRRLLNLIKDRKPVSI